MAKSKDANPNSDKYLQENNYWQSSSGNLSDPDSIPQSPHSGSTVIHRNEREHEADIIESELADIDPLSEEVVQPIEMIRVHKNRYKPDFSKD